MMLSSSAHLTDAKHCRELGLHGYLTKPVKQSELLNGILNILKVNLDEDEHDSHGQTEQSCSRTKQVGPLQILLAEDNPVNQRVAAGILEKRGHRATIVENGLQVMQALEVQKFDAVLMDVQMPEMDGLRATKAIRQRERTNGGHIPIVAMTARAMKGDREECLSAGMDDYVSKPIQSRELMAAIDRAMQKANKLDQSEPREKNACHPDMQVQSAATTQQSERSATPSFGEVQPAINLLELLDRVENDVELLQEMVELFLDISPRLLGEMEAAVAARDSENLERTAHALKGSLANLSAEQGAYLALQLERMGREKSVDIADLVLEELKSELQRVHSELLFANQEGQIHESSSR
jgi:CheY-like chemotaxis protein/HPt (histidine-containing phosphotransfer) domain-containing protein